MTDRLSDVTERTRTPGRCRCGYVPPYLLKQIRLAEGATDAGVDTAHLDGVARTQRKQDSVSVRGGSYTATGKVDIRVHDLDHQEEPLPGRLVRSTGLADPTGDPTADAVYDNTVIVQSFYDDIFKRGSVDERGEALVSSVHYGVGVNNAFWDGRQMIYGDGDGHNFLPFGLSLEVVAHELSHAVMSATSDLDYHGESGALNESFCDVMASLVVQHRLGVEVTEADWLMGRDVVGPALGIEGFRSFRADPAYRDQLPLSDPQPKHFKDYVMMAEDDGGVHVNSGIANHAYYRAAMAIGGKAWEGAGRIWYEAFTDLPRHADFADAARATVVTAGRIFGTNSDAQKGCRDAWKYVGVDVTS